MRSCPSSVGPEKWRLPRKTMLYPHSPKVPTKLLQYSPCSGLLPKPDQLLRGHTRTIVSQVRPFPFCSADRFHYHTESDRRCGTERVWLARLLHSRSQPHSNDVLQMESVRRESWRIMFTPETPVANETVVYASIRQVSEPASKMFTAKRGCDSKCYNHR